MTKANISKFEELKSVLSGGGIAVIPADTVYGIVAHAHNKDAVEKVFNAKGRSDDKPPITLISTIEQVEDFGVRLTDSLRKELHKYWPGCVTLILPCEVSDKNRHLVRGSRGISLRLPSAHHLLELLKVAGPIIAPSANIQGEEPARLIEKAKEYFGDLVDFYLDGGHLQNEPSRIIDLTYDEPKILR